MVLMSASKSEPRVLQTTSHEGHDVLLQQVCKWLEQIHQGFWQTREDYLERDKRKRKCLLIIITSDTYVVLDDEYLVLFSAFRITCDTEKVDKHGF